jgi:predicted nucleotidyltransferase
MTIPELPPLVERSLQRLIRTFSPERVVLFGSYAKGTTHINSDVDLLIITNMNINKAQYKHRARQLTADSFPSIDVVFATREDLALATINKSPFLLSILQSGITIYNKA